MKTDNSSVDNKSLSTKGDDNDNQKLSVEIGITEDQVLEQNLEKKVLRKLDWNLMTLFSLLFLFSNLDRAAIGNAGLTTFESDLGLEGNQYGTAVSVFYATYIVFEPISTVLMKILTPKYLITAFTLMWAVITIGTAFVTDYKQLVGIRLLLGLAESAIIPCITMYITMVYNRDEYTVRKSYGQIASAASGAFGGLLAYGLTQIQGTLHGWQWLFLIEGILSFCLVPVTFFWLPRKISEAFWLTPDEKTFIAQRQLQNRGVYDESEKFRWAEVRRCFRDWKIYVQAVIHFGTNLSLFGATTFMPKIIAGLGITTTVNSQLLTVPVYFLAGFSFWLLALYADRTKKPSTVVIIGLSFVIIGYILLLAVSHPGGRFFGLFILSLGFYSAPTTNIVWCATMHAGYFKRAVATGMVQFVGNISGAVIGFIYTTQSAPRYMMGLEVTLAFSVLSLVLTVFLSLMLKRENKRRDELISQGARDQPELGDENPHFKYFA